MKVKFSLLSALTILTFGCNSGNKSSVSESIPIDFSDSLQIEMKVDTFSIVSANKLELTRAYNNANYKLDDYRLIDPKMIVVHYTAIPDLQLTLNYFKADSLDSRRTKIKKHSALNVGIHYVIDKDGSVFSLMPDSIVARHLIGFNHLALGIENVAKDSTELTSAQLESNLKLVKFLSSKHPSIDYLIGHHEYNDVNLEHYSLLRTADTTYRPYSKPDPGIDFINKLRNGLKEDYGLVFKK